MEKSIVLKINNFSQSFNEQISKITTPIFSKVLKETPSNSMAIVGSDFKRYWRPNNYRRQIHVKERNNSTIKNIKSAIGTRCSVGNHNKLVFVKDYEGCLIQLGKNKLTAIYTQNIIHGEKETYLIEAKTIKAITNWIENKNQEIMKILDNALFSFAREFKLIKPLEKPIWSRFEDWTRDKEIDKLPKECIVHVDNGKKVYPLGWEFTGGLGDAPTEQLITRIKNSALSDVSPLIEKRLDELKDLLQIKENPLEHIKVNAKSINDLIHKYSIFIKKLSIHDKKDLEIWIFNKFNTVMI